MRTRLDLQKLLEKTLGSRNVYFQPPPNVQMKYPAIVYKRQKIDNDFGDDLVYMQSHFYSVIVIDSNPDSQIVMDISRIPGIQYDRNYVSDNLYHDVFTLYY